MTYLDDESVSYYETPMNWGADESSSRRIDSGMRGGVPKSLHGLTAAFFGERSATKERVPSKPWRIAVTKGLLHVAPS
jgi:hypothetical protein